MLMKNNFTCEAPGSDQINVDETDEQHKTVHQLMPFKVREILLVSSLYDAFIIEEEGLISEMVIGEYRDLQLSSPPRVTRVKSGKEALARLKQKTYDLVITMSKNIGMDPFTFGKKIKELCPETPVYLLATDTADLVKAQKKILNKNIDASFFWMGDSKLFLALVKLFEDRINASYDIKNGNVRVIILVEDSVRYYSMFLPMLYAEIVRQTERSISEDVNELQKLLRRRARPKILLARTFEEAMELFNTYEQNVLGVISDIGFYHHQKEDAEAGFILIKQIRNRYPFLPVLMQSSLPENKEKAEALDTSFLYKHSPHLLQDIHQFLLDHLGFGDFVFLKPIDSKISEKMGKKRTYRELGRASNMEEFERYLQHIPLESIRYHALRNDFSNWLLARGEFSLALTLQQQTVSDFKNIDEIRAYLLHVFNETRRKRQLGVITDFHHQTFEFDSTFTRLGSDSLGGKGRGIAFIRKLLNRYQLQTKFDDVNIIVPNTIGIATDFFDAFMDQNHLAEFFEDKNLSDKEIANHFLSKKLPEELVERLELLIKHFKKPLAVRSSSLLEDSQNHPFAGLYSTYMLPNNHPDESIRLKQLCDAIKLVYASVFYRDAQQYIKATAATAEEEKMAIVIQELIGKQYKKYFYPTISGVAQSYNYYPVGRQKAKEGVVSIAVGLGTTVVGGEHVLRFCPRYPQMLPDFSSTDQILENAQTKAYVLNTQTKNILLNEQETNTLEKVPITRLIQDDSLQEVTSYYDQNDGVIRDGLSDEHPNLITFAGVLKYPSFSFSEVLKELLYKGEQAMGCPVEIEFAVNLASETYPLKKPEFAILQIRPLIVSKEQEHVSFNDVDEDDILMQSYHALGHGVYTSIRDLIYVVPDRFNAGKTLQISDEIDRLNARLSEKNIPYILVGPGRFGTQDRWLGVPVRWAQISGARIIVETDLSDFHVKPSQGTHFLQNITAQGIGYLHIPYGKPEEFVRWNAFIDIPIIKEYTFVKHIRFSQPLLVKIDGKKRKAIVAKKTKKETPTL